MDGARIDAGQPKHAHDPCSTNQRGIAQRTRVDDESHREDTNDDAHLKNFRSQCPHVVDAPLS